MSVTTTRTSFARIRRFSVVLGAALLLLALVIAWYRRTAYESFFIQSSPTRTTDELVVSLGTDSIAVTLHGAPAVWFPAGVDSNSPAVWLDGRLAVLNSTSSGTYISRGEAIDNLSETIPVDLPVPGRQGSVWMEAVWHDPETGVLYGWYHFEPEDLVCYPLTAPIIGAAVSYDGGQIWEDRGFLIENGYDYDCGYQNEWFAGGSGDFSVIVDANSGYFYFLYSNYVGTPEEVGIAIARSALDERGQPGTAWKYFRGEWNEPGLGGRSSAIFRSRTGWQGPGIDAFWGPSVHWNHYLEAYVVLLNRATDPSWTPDAVYISFSHDLVNWTTPERLFIADSWYPQVIGLEAGESDSSAGKLMRVFVGGFSTFYLEFSKKPLEARDFESASPADSLN